MVASEPYSAVYAKHLLPLFASVEPARHPWWWPKDGGKTLADWGLTEQQVLEAGSNPDAVLRSLRLGPSGKSPPSRDYADFPGSVVLNNSDDLVWILSSRPSSDSFPNSGPTTTKLYRVLKEAGLLDRAHITDFIKIHGPGPDALAGRDFAELLVAGESGTSVREVSLRCLDAEWDVAPPRTVLVAGGITFRWIRDQLSRPGSTAESTLLRNLGVAMKPVTSWMAMKRDTTIEVIADEWRRAAE